MGVFSLFGKNRQRPFTNLDTDVANSKADKAKLSYTRRRNRPSKLFWEEFEIRYRNSLSAFTPSLLYSMQDRVDGKTDSIVVGIDSIVEDAFYLTDIMLFISGTYYAALLDNKIVSIADEGFLLSEFFSVVTETIDAMDVSPQTKELLKNRIFEYGRACHDNVLCGSSMFGLLEIDFDGIDRWCQNKEVKCALLLCDYIAYRKKFKQHAKLCELQNIKSFSVNNTKNDIDYLEAIYGNAFSTSGAIFGIVAELIGQYAIR